MQNESKTVTLIIVALFKPVLRLALRYGLRLQEILEALKVALAQVGQAELKRQSDRGNLSKLSLLTGIQRRELKRLISGEKKTDNLNLLSRILGQWQTHPDFSSKGRADALAVSGAESEFANLVKSISTDVNPYTVLAALEEKGALKRQGAKVVLVKKVLTPAEGSLDGLEMLAADSNNLFEAVTTNILDKPEVPNLHITTSYDNISLQELEKIREWVLDQGTAFHEAARIFLAKHDKDANPRIYKKEGGAKVTITTFSLISGGHDEAN